MQVPPVQFVQSQLTILRQIASEHEEYLPDEGREFRTGALVRTFLSNLTDAEQDESELPIVKSVIKTNLDTWKQIVFFGKKVIEHLHENRTDVSALQLNEDERKLVELLVLFVEYDQIKNNLISKLIKDELSDSEETEIEEFVLRFSSKLDSLIPEERIPLKNRIITTYAPQLAFLTLGAFYHGEILKMLRKN